ncbi:MAG: DUF4406 domain-containing protein [Treponemataceae bacterium]
MKVYISGRITGLDKEVIFKKFNKIQNRLKKDGNLVMSPTTLAMNEGFEHEDYMHICYAMIDVCDAIFMLKDWQDSKGAKMELQYAKNCKKITFYEDKSTCKS